MPTVADIQAVISPTSSTSQASLDGTHKANFLTTAARKYMPLGLTPRDSRMDSDASIATRLKKQAVHGHDSEAAKEARWSLKWLSRGARRSQDIESDRDSYPALSNPSTSTTPSRKSSATSFDSNTSASLRLGDRRTDMALVDGNHAPLPYASLHGFPHRPTLRQRDGLFGGVYDPSGIEVHTPLLSVRVPGEFPAPEAELSSWSNDRFLASPECAPARKYLRLLENIVPRDVQSGKAEDASLMNQEDLEELMVSDSCGDCKPMGAFANGPHWKGKAKVSSIQSIDWSIVPEQNVEALCSVYNQTNVYTYDVAHVTMGAALGTDSWGFLDSFTATTTLTSTNPAADASSGSDMAKQKQTVRSAKAADASHADRQKRDLKHREAVVSRHTERVRDKTRRKVEALDKKVRYNDAQLQKRIQDMKDQEQARLEEQERIRLEVQRRIEEDNLAAAVEFQRKWNEEQDDECWIVAVRTLRKECAVCGDQKDKWEFPVRSSTVRCEHEAQICSECLDSWIASALSDNGVDGVKCPECPEKLAYIDVQKLASEATFEAFDKATILMALSSLPDFAWCLGPNCKNGQLNIENSNFMECASCGYKQCLQHKVLWHTGESCAQYEYRTSGAQARTEEAKTMAMLDTMSKRCPGPNCGWRIEKSDGCDHVTCRKCRFEFCWQCLASHQEIRRVGNTAHKKECKFHSTNLDLAWPFNRH